MRRPRVGKRVTGVSTPIGGVSWETVPDVETEALTRLVAFLADRRVLYNPSEVEDPAHCAQSVLRIREFLGELAGPLPRNSHLAAILHNMAGACRGFLDRLPRELPHGPLGRPGPGWGLQSWVFNQALGELRGQLGVYLHELVQQYGLIIEPPLVSILPPAPDGGAR